MTGAIRARPNVEGGSGPASRRLIRSVRILKEGSSVPSFIEVERITFLARQVEIKMLELALENVRPELALRLAGR